MPFSSLQLFAEVLLLLSVLLASEALPSEWQASKTEPNNSEEDLQRRLQKQQYIVGGSQASQGDYPWFAAFYPNLELEDDKKVVACGGTYFVVCRLSANAVLFVANV